MSIIEHPAGASRGRFSQHASAAWAAHPLLRAAGRGARKADIGIEGVLAGGLLHLVVYGKVSDRSATRLDEVLSSMADLRPASVELDLADTPARSSAVLSVLARHGNLAAPPSNEIETADSGFVEVESDESVLDIATA